MQKNLGVFLQWVKLYFLAYPRMDGSAACIPILRITANDQTVITYVDVFTHCLPALQKIQSISSQIVWILPSALFASVLTSTFTKLQRLQMQNNIQQCKICQAFFRTKCHCALRAHFLKYGKSHSTAQCTLSKTQQTTLQLCEESHPDYYRFSTHKISFNPKKSEYSYHKKTSTTN
jgi:hypothetical protein